MSKHGAAVVSGITSAKTLATWVTFAQWQAIKGRLKDMQDCLVSIEIDAHGRHDILGDMDGIEANVLLQDMRDRDGTKC